MNAVLRHALESNLEDETKHLANALLKMLHFGEHDVRYVLEMGFLFDRLFFQFLKIQV